MQNQLTLAEIKERRERAIAAAAAANGNGNGYIKDEEMPDIDAEIKSEVNGSDSKESAADVKPAGESGTTANGKNGNGNKKDDKDKAPGEQVDLSLIAPDGGARRAKVNPFQKKTRQVILGDETARKLRYEEHYPWVLEDFDGKNTWVGNYEAGQADSFVLFMFDKDGFKMIPAEKYYKMTPRNKYNTLTAEEAEKRMQKGEQPNRWIMKYFPSEGEENSGSSRPVNMRRRFQTVDHSVPDEDSIRRNEDQEEIDFDEEFADDEEAPIMDGNEEDVKEVEKKIKKELRGDATDALFEEEEEEEKQNLDKNGQKLIKSLRSLENNGNYESDEEGNPYATEESSSDEEEVGAAADAKVQIKEEPPEVINGLKPVAGNVAAGAAASASATMAPGATVAEGMKKKDKKLKKDKLKKDKKKKKGIYAFEIDAETGKKVYKNLPVGTVVLQLSPSVLSDFPPNAWNPQVKRPRVEENGYDIGKPKPKKLKIKTEPDTEAVQTTPTKITDTTAALANATISGTTPAESTRTTNNNVSRQASPTTLSRDKSPDAASTTAGSNTITTENDADLITEEDVASIIRSNRVTTKQLLGILKPKLKRHSRNNKLLKELVPKIAKLSEGALVLKEQH
ncbi:hypothetical protein D0Z00_004491 [Geotrichum galactomycetum]|uniref:Uncharacterized protein n=1 Tax=Geotrichum galactomycetum TaxID=27317 RepID=A0ACB6UYH5_9ASCO|nr:hypothetical protein D0Z00_004491 [Geotrichum candidum]